MAVWKRSVPSDHGRIEVNLRRKETEAGWVSVMDRFGLQATPTWFNWLGWVLALGALHFLHARSHSALFATMLLLSYGLLWLYFLGFFYRIEIKGVPLLANPTIARIVSIVISGLLAFTAWSVATFVAREIARFQQAS